MLNTYLVLLIIYQCYCLNILVMKMKRKCWPGGKHRVVGDVGDVGENLGDVGENLGDVGENIGGNFSILK